MKKLYFFSRITPLLFVLFLFAGETATAQNGYALWGFRDVQQSSFLNPAFTSGAKTVIGIPIISNFSTGLVTTAGGLSNFVPKKANADSIYLDFSNLLNNGHLTDKITEFLDNDILFAGFKAGSTFITMGVRQHLFIQTVLDHNLLRLLQNPSQSENRILDLSNTNVMEHQIMDYHLGISIPIAKRFRIGARLHILQGLSDITSENDGITMKITRSTHNKDYEFQAHANFRIHTAGLPDTNNFNLANYLGNFENMGFAIDLGAEARISNNLWLTASFINWGKIHFKSYTKSYYPTKHDANFSSSSFDINNGDDPIGQTIDTLKSIFSIKSISESYSIKLPTRFIVGVEYFTKDLRNDFSVLFSGRSFQDYFEPAVSVGYTRFVSPHFSVKANYTWIKDAPMNVGLAMAVNFSPFQFYVYSDNVPGLFQWDRQKYVQAGFGLNIRIAPHNNRKNPDNPEAIHNLRPDIVQQSNNQKVIR